jgi:hypothetical protein
MPTVNRTTLLREPGKMIFAGANLYSQGDLQITPVITTTEVATSAHGVIDRDRVTDRIFTISGVLAGAWKDLSVLFAIMALKQGESVFGSSDTPLVIHGRRGTKITFTNGAITRPPAIVGKTGATMFGAFEATCIISNNGDPEDEESYFSITNQAYPGDADFDPAELLTLPLSAAWGSTAPWDDFLTQEGWEITPTVRLSPVPVDGVGTVDMRVADMSVTATAIPVGPTLAQQFAKMSFGQGLGARRALGDDLILSAPGVYITVSDAAITSGDTGYGDRPLIGATTWTANRKWASTAPQPLLTVADAPPAPPEEE